MMLPFYFLKHFLMFFRLPCFLLLHYFAGGLFTPMRQHIAFCQLLETSLAFVQIASNRHCHCLA
jgi:hypothetical protein